MRKANSAIIRERHVIPKLEDILTELNGAKFFTKLDLTEGYHQIELHKDSRHITTFATHQGLYRYKRLIYGISCAFESFQKQIEMSISNCPKSKNISDDILIWGNDLVEHNNNLERVLQKLNADGLKINPRKCKFAVNTLAFNGHIITSSGISPDPAKVKSIKQLKPPTNISEVKSLLGMINFCNRFISDYSTLTEPIRRLTKKDIPFTWSNEQQTVLQALQEKLTHAPTLAFYNPLADTKLYVDASPHGLGAILTQQQTDTSYHPIAYGSRALTPTESRYSQTEREALAVLWSCQHFHYYIYDSNITVITDHKPLESLLVNNLNSTMDSEATGIQPNYKI